LFNYHKIYVNNKLLLMKKKIKLFIAGHKGFLGSTILREFSKDKKYKILTIEKNKINLKSYQKLNYFFQKNKPEYVINAAGLVGGILVNMKNQIDFLEENFLIQSNLLKVSYLNNVKKYINLASSCIYPKNCKQPIKEKYLLSGNLEETNEGYALAKICGLKLAQFYNEKYNFNSITLLPCNLYGENDKYFDENSHFISAIISKIYLAKINNKRKVKLWGTGNPKREIMHVEDAARAIKLCLQSKFSNQNINIGSGIDFSISKYANLIKKKLNYNGKIIWDKAYPDGVKRKLLDISYLKNKKFKNKYSIELGLDSVIRSFLTKI